MSEKEKFKPYAAAYLVLIKDGQILTKTYIMASSVGRLNRY